jgi:hypothetical protein
VTFAMRLCILPVLLIGVSAADAPSLQALGQLQPGRWTLTSKDADFGSRSICLSDPRMLLQVRQPPAACSHFVVANTPNAATVTYTCPRAGSGRTTVRVETPRLAQVETQGITGGVPFDNSIEARRVGDCTALSMLKTSGR